MTIKLPSSPYPPNSLEMLYWSKDQCVVGLDEAGRGCLAGPVVAAAVILPQKHTFLGLKDSKLLSAHDRESAFSWITKNCLSAVGIIDHHEIDRINIYNASKKAMIRALTTLIASGSQTPQAVLIDALSIPLVGTGLSVDTPVFWAPQGEHWSESIAAASIIAKVTRDRLMNVANRTFPFYKLEQHKGYSTKIHQEAILEHGRSLIHRETFLKNLFTVHVPDYGTQQTLC